MPCRAFPSIRGVRKSNRAASTEIRARRHHDDVPDTNALRLLPAEENDVGQFGGFDEVWVSQSVAVFSEADTHFGVDIDDADVAGCFSFLQRCEELVLVSAKPFCT